MSDHLGTREIQHFIDGRYTASITRQTFAKSSSLSNLPIARVAEGGDANVDAAVTAARYALHGEWGRMSTEKRSAMLHAVAEEITCRQDDLVAAEEADTDSEEELLPLVNANRYGLFTTIWTNDLSRAHRVATNVDVGITSATSWFLRGFHTRFGGAPQSGISREGRVHSLKFYTEVRKVRIKL